MSTPLPLWDRIRNRVRELQPSVTPDINLVETIVREELEAAAQHIEQEYNDKYAVTNSLTRYGQSIAEYLRGRQR